MELKICEVIRKKRREMNISQEVLAEKLGITVQAVSKWENNLSYPDITILPEIADFFGLTMNGLFFGSEEKTEAILTDLPDDNRLRVVQCVGSRVLSREEYDSDKKIKLIIPEHSEKVLNVEIWGGAEIDGDISGDLKSGAGVCCGDVGGNVFPNGGMNCGDIGGSATVSGSVNCGDVGGDITADGNINCANVSGDATSGSKISCASIGGDATAEGDIECEIIKGDAKAENNIIKKG